MSIRWTKDDLPREPQTRPIELPPDEHEERRPRRWLWTGLAAGAFFASGNLLGWLWGQEGVNYLLGAGLILLAIDSANRLDAIEEARAEADLARRDAAEARADAAEARLEIRRVSTDVLALARLFYGEADETTTGRHGRRD